MMITNYQMVQIVWFTVLIHVVRQLHTFRVVRYDEPECSSAQYFRYFQSNQDFEERICHFTVPRMHIT